MAETFNIDGFIIEASKAWRCHLRKVYRQTRMRHNSPIGAVIARKNVDDEIWNVTGKFPAELVGF